MKRKNGISVIVLIIWCGMIVVLYGSAVADITPLSNLPNLEKLELSYTPLESLDALYTMPKLKKAAYYHCDGEAEESNAFEARFGSRGLRHISTYMN